MGLSYAAVQSDEWINEWISLRPLEVGADKNESYNFVIRTRNLGVVGHRKRGMNESLENP